MQAFSKVPLLTEVLSGTLSIHKCTVLLTPFQGMVFTVESNPLFDADSNPLGLIRF